MKLDARSGSTALRHITAYSWTVVVLIALVLSNWSLLIIGHHYGLPVPLAAILSVPFDGAALISADISLRYAREHGANGAGPRVAVTILAGLSAWLNSLHATILHDPLPAHIMYATPPLVALYLFEAQIRYARRDALRAAGRLSEPRPILGLFIWSRHPLDAHKTMQAISGQRLSARAAIESARISAAVQRAVTPASLQRATTQADAIRAALRELGETVSAAEVTDWLGERGWPVDASAVRTVRSRDQGRDIPLQDRTLPHQERVTDDPASLNGASPDQHERDTAALP